MQIRSISVWAYSRQRDHLHRPVEVDVRQNSKRKFASYLCSQLIHDTHAHAAWQNCARCRPFPTSKSEPAAKSADSDEGGHLFRSKADSVPIDCGQHSDDPGP